MKLQIYYGLFDPATDMGGGKYWTWFDKEVPLKLLNHFYYEIAVKHLAPEPNKLTADDLWGGIAQLDSDWTVLYRIFNGGYDRQDRPGRYVILTAWIKTRQTTHIDLSPILRNKTFQNIAAFAKELPVPTPDTLTETYIGTKTRQTLSLPDDNFKKNFIDTDAVEQAMEYFANIPPGRFASLKIVMTSSEKKVVLEGKAKRSLPETQVKTPMAPPIPQG